VFFDAGNTLLRMDYEAIAEQLAVHGVRARVAAVEQAEWRARVRLDDELLAARGPGLSTESGGTADFYLRRMLEELGVADEAVVQAVSAWRRQYNPPVGVWGTAAPRAVAALARAREAGLRTAVISNSNGSVRAILAGLGLGSGLDFVLDSAEVGVEKPDPRIFQLALERARVRPTEAVYVGDLYSIDVLGARAAGLDAILLDPGAHWGPRDCPTAADVLAAVELLLRGSG
jgi:putative hydrolase of the HAD superfamily